MQNPGVEEVRRSAGPPSRRVGFTVIEILVVTALMAILAVVVVGVGRAAQNKAKRGNAEAAIKRVAMGLEAYRAEYGQYPETDETAELIDWLYRIPFEEGEGLIFVEFKQGELAEHPRTGEANLWRDPWGTEYRYIHPEAYSGPKDDIHNPDSYDLYSAGPDTNFYSEADNITNW